MHFNLKKSITLGLVVTAMGILSAGCSHNTQNGAGNSDKKHSIALITDFNGVDDHSYNEIAWKGFTDYGKEHHLKRGAGGYQYFESNGASDFVPNLNQAASAGYQTIYGVGFTLTDSIKAASKKNPKRNFVIVDSVITGRKNVVSTIFKSNDASYLAGLAAAGTTKTGKVGFVGGVRSSVIDLFEAGFRKGVADGAKALKKKVTVNVQYVGDFTSTDKAKSIAKSMYADNADIVYQAAGQAGNGVFQEAKDYNKTRLAKQKVWVIGVDIDQEKLGNYVSKDGKKENFTLTSVLKGLDVVCKDIADKAYHNKFPGGKTLVYGLDSNGVSLTRGHIDAKTWSSIKKARQAIIDGKIKVPVKPAKK